MIKSVGVGFIIVGDKMFPVEKVALDTEQPNYGHSPLCDLSSTLYEDAKRFSYTMNLRSAPVVIDSTAIVIDDEVK